MRQHMLTRGKGQEAQAAGLSQTVTAASMVERNKLLDGGRVAPGNNEEADFKAGSQTTRICPWPGVVMASWSPVGSLQHKQGRVQGAVVRKGRSKHEGPKQCAWLLTAASCAVTTERRLHCACRAGHSHDMCPCA